MTELEKLPQARRYLRAARWGLKNHWTKRYKAAAVFFRPRFGLIHTF